MGDYLTIKIQTKGTAGPCEVGYLRAGFKYEQFGNTFGALNTNSTTATKGNTYIKQYNNRVTGEREHFALASDGSNMGIFKHNTGTDNWDPVADFGSLNTWYNTTGLVHVVGTDGKPYLVYIAANFNGILRFWSYDGTSWSLVQTGNLGNNSGRIGMAHNGIFHWKYHSTSAVFGTWDPRALVWSTQTVPSYPAATASWQNFFRIGTRLFFVGTKNGGAGGFVLEYIINGWQVLGDEVTFPDLANYSGNVQSMMSAAFRIAEDKTLIIHGGNSAVTNTPDGVYATLFQLVAGSLVVTDVTDPVVPTILRSGTTVGATNSFEYGFYGVSDNEETPGAPKHTMFFCPDNGSNTPVGFTKCTIVDELTTFTIEEALQVDNQWHVPRTESSYSAAGGEMTYYPGGLTIQVMDELEVAGGLQITFRCDGDPGNADKTVRLRYVDSLGIPVDLGTLQAGSVTGGTATNNTAEISNVDADPSITYTVVWNFNNGDGVPEGNRVALQLDIERP